MPQKRRYTPTAKPRDDALGRERTYRYYKMMWEAAHPEATPAEYEAAIKRITKELRL